MSSTVEVTPARRHSRARFLVLIPLFPALAALAFVAIVPLSAVSSDGAAQALPAAILQPVAAPAQATPAITASPSPSAAAAEIFSAPPITILPPPPPPKAAGKRSSGKVVSVGRCSAYGITDKSVSSAPYSATEQGNLGYLNQARAENGLGALAWGGGLSNAARAWATYLADNNCVGSEIGHSVIWTNGENVYWISGGSGGDLAVRAHNAFMASTGHRANVLRATFTSVGIGVAHGAGGWYLVQNYAR
jgi:uncharacterized protein YkwD